MEHISIYGGITPFSWGLGVSSGQILKEMRRAVFIFGCFYIGIQWKAAHNNAQQRED